MWVRRRHANRRLVRRGRASYRAQGDSDRGDLDRAIHHPDGGHVRQCPIFAPAAVGATNIGHPHPIRTRLALLSRRDQRTARRRGQHGHARRTGNHRSIRLQRLSDGHPRRGPSLLRGIGGHHHPRPGRQAHRGKGQARGLGRDSGTLGPATRHRPYATSDWRTRRTPGARLKSGRHRRMPPWRSSGCRWHHRTRRSRN